MNHRPFAGQELKIEAHAFQWQQKVRENDGGIDVELFRGGDSHLGSQFRLLANLQQRMVAAYGLVLGHVAARLAQKPYRRLIHRLAQAGAQKPAAAGEAGIGAGLLH